MRSRSCIHVSCNAHGVVNPAGTQGPPSVCNETTYLWTILNGEAHSPNICLDYCLSWPYFERTQWFEEPAGSGLQLGVALLVSARTIGIDLCDLAPYWLLRLACGSAEGCHTETVLVNDWLQGLLFTACDRTSPTPRQPIRNAERKPMPLPSALV
ncbi:hypothetical protein CC78DRAFT_584686 [Lojkania enalia]|uniref:Uncharacterized protein n=1 Tax=Lojkania enalia TaxID=147567 RepID=A0A9P4K6W3_9PLEO|nr:hypothetical protein CC78DRAFT_584686 [Didymosphaeria enalia]